MECFPKATIIQKKVASNVPEQPKSKQETLLGAFNRCMNALTALDNASMLSSIDFVIGMESGMWLTHKSNLLLLNLNYSPFLCSDDPNYVWVDGGVVVIKNVRKKQTIVLFTKEMVIPLNYDKPGENGNWSRLKDPHAEYGVSRSVYFYETLLKWKQIEMNKTSSSSLFSFINENKPVFVFTVLSIIIAFNR